MRKIMKKRKQGFEGGKKSSRYGIYEVEFKNGWTVEVEAPTPRHAAVIAKKYAFEKLRIRPERLKIKNVTFVGM
jgi:hypothetical protein